MLQRLEKLRDSGGLTNICSKKAQKSLLKALQGGKFPIPLVRYWLQTVIEQDITSLNHFHKVENTWTILADQKHAWFPIRCFWLRLCPSVLSACLSQIDRRQGRSQIDRKPLKLFNRDAQPPKPETDGKAKGKNVQYLGIHTPQSHKYEPLTSLLRSKPTLNPEMLYKNEKIYNKTLIVVVDRWAGVYGRNLTVHSMPS